jgi:hypothetical protein
LARMKTLIHSRQPQEQEELERMYQRYAQARKPAKGRCFDVAFACTICFWIVGICGHALSFIELGKMNMDIPN